jgi:hypothetical protein
LAVGTTDAEAVRGSNDASEEKVPPRQNWGDLANLKVILSILSLLLYVILWIGYATFYNRFHLSPLDLGFGYVDVLMQSAVAIIVVLGVVVYVASWVFLLVESRKTRPSGFTAMHFTSIGVWLVAVGSLIVDLLYFVIGVLGSPESRVLAFSLSGIFIAAVGPQVVGYINANLQGRPNMSRAEGTTAPAVWWRRGIFALAVAALIAASGKVLLEAYHDRSHVLNGEPASFRLAGLPVTGWGAQKASFDWTSASAAAGVSTMAGRCLLYFGESGGTAYFYRANKVTHQGVLLRIPAGSIVVHSGAGNVACRGK